MSSSSERCSTAKDWSSVGEGGKNYYQERERELEIVDLLYLVNDWEELGEKRGETIQ